MSDFTVVFSEPVTMPPGPGFPQGKSWAPGFPFPITSPALRDYIRGLPVDSRTILEDMVFNAADVGALAGVTSITGTAAQSNATDATANRLMRVGAFGLGGAGASPPGDNLNNITASGIYNAGSSTANAPAAFCVVLHMQRTADRAIQIAGQATTASTEGGWRRERSGAGWSPWRRDYHAGNIIGTVSQSGGVPTGAGFEAGANASGVYVRFADGSQICWHSESAAGEQATSQGIGNIFRSPESRSFTFPASFSTPPKVTPDAIRTAGVVWPAQGSGSISNNSFSGVFLMSATSNGAGRLGYIAVGRWFNL